MFLYLLTFMSVAILIIGIFETMRIDYFFTIGDDLINPTDTPAEIYADYLEMKNTYIFTNEPFIDLMNFVGLFAIFYIMYAAWKMGRDSLPFKINEVLNTYSLLFILGFYIVIVIFNYMVDVFVNQLIVLLFNDILVAIYMFDLLITYFPFLVLAAAVLSFIANQLKYFSLLRNQIVI